MIYVIKNKTNIRNRCNQVPNPTQDNTWESDFNTKKKHYIQESQETNHFQAGGHKAAMVIQDSMTDTKHN